MGIEHLGVVCPMCEQACFSVIEYEDVIQYNHQEIMNDKLLYTFCVFLKEKKERPSEKTSSVGRGRLPMEWNLTRRRSGYYNA